MLEVGARGALGGWERGPGLLGDPVEGGGGVEEPVAAVGDDGFEEGGREGGGGILNAGVDAVGVGV